MTLLQDVRIAAVPFERFVPVLGQARVDAARSVAAAFRARLRENAVWNVSSTAVGGGVAEMLPSLLAYARGEQVDTRWVVIQGNPEFFDITKRIHHALHGSEPQGGVPRAADRAVYEAVCLANAVELAQRLTPGDVVLLHDPQTAGMADHLIQRGARVVWRCHIGHDERTPEVEAGWRFLAPYLHNVQHLVFSRQAYVPTEVDSARATIIQPSIDVFSPKNEPMPAGTAHAILAHVGLLAAPCPADAHPIYQRRDGSPARVERVADIVRSGPPPAADVPLVVQVSRWDPLKDMGGVLAGFAHLVETGRGTNAALVLAGPNVHAVTDDPEGPRVYREVVDQWYRLPDSVRSRVTLTMLPSSDVDENAAVVNALQRHAEIVVQKSLREGFGLTVTEAMWKARPVIGSRVGGIQDQIVHGESGLLVDDPHDRGAFADALADLIGDPARRRRMGAAAQERAREHFLGIRHMLEYAQLFEVMLPAEPRRQEAAHP